MHMPAPWGPYLREYGYWAVFAALMLENAGLPVPGESVLMAAGALAGRGGLWIGLVLLGAWAGAVAGWCLGTAIGRFGGRRLVLRYGRYVLLTEERLERAEGFFERYGGAVVVGARFMPGLRELSGLVAGTLRMPWRAFLVYNAVGAALWVGFWGTLAYVVGERARWLVAHWVWLVAAVGAVAVVLGVVYVLRRRRGSSGNGPAQGVS